MTAGRLAALILAGCLLAGSAGAAKPAPAAQASAETAAPTAAPAPAVRPLPGRPTVQAPAYAPGPSAGSLVQTIFALTLVLALLAALAWVMKRYGPNVQAGAGGLRIVGALNLGGRERIMVVEIGDQWIVVGASPGRVSALATMPKQEGSASIQGHAPAASSFSEWLKQTIDKRNAK